MAMAILVIALLCLLAVLHTQWTVRQEIRDAKSRILGELKMHSDDISGTADEVVKISEVLTKASALKVQRESVFDAGDKIPDRQPSRLAYVPVARRRAAAEMASTGPQTHIEKVRENNAKAMS